MFLGRRLSGLNVRVLSHTTLPIPTLLYLRQSPPQIKANPSRTFTRLAPQKPQEDPLPVISHKKNSVVHDGSSIVLSDEQQRVLDMVLAGKNVFFTGSAGTGKSVLLREIVRTLREQGKVVEVTASTGVAAVNIGGQTLHSFAGIGTGSLESDDLVRRAMGSKKTKQRWRNTDVLVIDEISMVDAKLFGTLNDIGKQARRRPTPPFGGIQLVICGDFFQLPPVPDNFYGRREKVYYAFEAECWEKAVPNMITLTKVFRQKEPMLIHLLNDMRQGIVSPESARLLRGLSRELSYEDGIQPTELYPHRKRAEAANEMHMDQLPGNTHIFYAKDQFGVDTDGQPASEETMGSLLDKMIASKLKLRVGAQVMCVKNLPGTGIVNGSVGTIVQFLTPSQVEKGTYNLRTRGLNKETKIDLIPGTKKFPEGKWPVVEYENGKVILMTPVQFEQQNGRGGMEARRVQVPLILAWALTIHKAQGQTLSRVKIDLAKAFAHGQVYVALSRCTSLKGLQVLNFSHRAVTADQDVIEWSENLLVLDDE